jgi:hypothetical protein
MKIDLDEARSQVKMAFGQSMPPKEILEKPFEGDVEPLLRLCGGEQGDSRYDDLVTYCLDLAYVDNLQMDLLAYLFPICLDAWHSVLKGMVDSTFNEHFHAALARRPILDELLSHAQRKAVKNFMRAAILDQMDGQDGDAFLGRGDIPHWFLTFNSYGTFSDGLGVLWDEWWSLSSAGRCNSALLYSMRLIYPDDDIFANVPDLWEYESIGFSESWLSGNIEFLKTTFTPSYLANKLEHIAGQLINSPHVAIARKMCADFEANRPLVVGRIAMLPKLLAMPSVPKGLSWEEQ